MLAASVLASLAALCSWLARIARARISRARWRRMPNAEVTPSPPSAAAAPPPPSATAAPSPPGSPPEHAGASSTATDSEMPSLVDVVVEEGDLEYDCQVVRNFAAAHGQLGTIDTLLEYAKGAMQHAEDLVGPERLEGIPGASGRKLLRFEGWPRLARLATRLVQMVLPHVGLKDEPVGIERGDGSVAGVSLIVTMPGAERQPSHLDADVEDVYSVIVPLTPRRVHVVSRPEPILLDPGDALVFNAGKLCHGGDGLALGEDVRVALFCSVGTGVTEEVITQSFECEWGSLAQWARSLPMAGLVAALQKLKNEKVEEVIAELHSRLLTGDAWGEAKRRSPEG